MAEEREPRPRTAEVFDGVAWDYDPEDHYLSPLVSARRYFRDFPWQPEAVMVDQPEAVTVDRPEAVTVDQPTGGAIPSESASAASTRR